MQEKEEPLKRSACHGSLAFLFQNIVQVGMG